MPDSSFIDTLAEALRDSDDQTLDEIQKELQDEGTDVARLEKRLLEYEEKIRDKERKAGSIAVSKEKPCNCPAHGSENECLYFKNGKCQHPNKQKRVNIVEAFKELEAAVGPTYKIPTES